MHPGRMPVATMPAAGRAAPGRVALRAATHAAHERMHRLAPFRAILEGTLEADRYPTLLQSLLLFHSTVRAAAADCGWSKYSSAPLRMRLLRRDLRFLGEPAPRPSIAWQPGSRDAALGALYAAEGSMLGGRVVAAQLDYLFGSALDGRRFFVGSPDDGARWRNLLAVLEERCAAKSALDQAIGGALLAFGLFERCVMTNGPNIGSASPRSSVPSRLNQPQLDARI